jgi:hypothetical protein
MLYSTLSLLFCSQVALGSVLKRVAPLPPAQDPFYRPPPGYENAAPGTILASRPAPARLQILNTIPVNIKQVTQLLYRTTNALGEPEVTVTTVMVPENASYDKVVSYQVAEDSGGQINCAPSYTLQTGSQALYAGTGNVEMLLIIGALNEGWIVNSPDWEGPNSTFIEGFQAGQATLDSVRAVLSSGKTTGVKSDAKVQMWGYSGGALASEWAMELQASYAPELKSDPEYAEHVPVHQQWSFRWDRRRRPPRHGEGIPGLRSSVDEATDSSESCAILPGRNELLLRRHGPLRPAEHVLVLLRR